MGSEGRPVGRKDPRQYREVGDLTELDVYAVHMLFEINDPSGCIQHASRKLLLFGGLAENETAYADVEEARDTLTRWLELHPRR
jgi:hypothetical protein